MTSYIYRPPTSWLGGGQVTRPKNNELIARGFYLTADRATLKPLRKTQLVQHYESEKQKADKAKDEERLVLEGLKRYLNKKEDKGFEKFAQHRPMT